MWNSHRFEVVATQCIRVAVVLCLLAVPVAAQDFTGTWYGRIESPVDNQYRKLVVAMAGTKLSCAFVQIAATSGADSTCLIEDGALQLVTATKNRVRLVASGGVLDGTTTSAVTGKSFHIRMAHDPVQAGIPSTVAVSGGYTFGMMRPAAADDIGSKAATLQTVTICGQKIDYAQRQPGSTSVAGSNLMGVWEGERGEPNPQGLDTSMCVGFVIEAIAPDGKVKATHAWGDRMRLLYNGNGIAIKPGVGHWQGQLTNNSIVLSNKNLNYEIHLAGLDKMRGTYQNAWGKADVSLTRQTPLLKR